MENASACEVRLYLIQWDHARTSASVDSQKLIYSGGQDEAREVFERVAEELGVGYIPLRSKFDVILELGAGEDALDRIDLLSTLFYAEAEGYYNQALKSIAEVLEKV
jgi:hypothetical protein